MSSYFTCLIVEFRAPNLGCNVSLLDAMLEKYIASLFIEENKGTCDCLHFKFSRYICTYSVCDSL